MKDQMNDSHFTQQQQTAVQTVLSQLQPKDTPAENILLSAVAGAGKTTTLVAIVQAVTQSLAESRVLFLAFNVAMVEQIRRRLEHIPSGSIDVQTIHAAGLQLLRANGRGSITVEPEKMYRTLREMRPAFFLSVR